MYTVPIPKGATSTSHIPISHDIIDLCHVFSNGIGFLSQTRGQSRRIVKSALKTILKSGFSFVWNERNVVVYIQQEEKHVYSSRRLEF